LMVSSKRKTRPERKKVANWVFLNLETSVCDGCNCVTRTSHGMTRLGNKYRIVDFALTERPDLFLICGDVFDRPKPSNEAKIFVVQKARELHEAGIPVIAIGGNHDIPKFESGPMAIAITELMATTVSFF